MKSLALLGLLCLQTPPAQSPPAQQPPVGAVPLAKDLPADSLPVDTLPAARAAWKQLVQALSPEVASGQVAKQIGAFDLTLQTRVETVLEGGSKQRNDVDLRYRYLGPGYVRTTLMQTGVERMRGPEGDFLWDAKKGDLIKLTGREYEQDRRELSQTLSISRNYLALCDPARLRIARLELLAAAPSGLPLIEGKAAKSSAVPLAATLQWIAITSPDFQVVEPVKPKIPGEQAMFKAQIGLDPRTHLPVLATIWQDEKGAMVAETAVLVDLKSSANYKRIDGHLVPTYFSVHDPLLPSSPFAFRPTPRVDVIVDSAKSLLCPALTSADFVPPQKSK